MRGVIGGMNISGIETHDYLMRQNQDFKYFLSPFYNYYFDKRTGYFARWGKTQRDDPVFSPFGPEILDLEISVNGCPNNCKFCYKSNNPGPPTNMSFQTFKYIMDLMPPTLTQVAFGITGVKTNPNFLKMLEYCRNFAGVIPNFTLTGIDLEPKMAIEISNLIGACAISCYPHNKNLCYKTVKTFQQCGIEQTNIHLLVAKETLEHVYNVLGDYRQKRTQPNAIVFLGVKPKGRAEGQYTPLSQKEYDELVEDCFSPYYNTPIGFDSCSAHKFMKSLEKLDKPAAWKRKILQLVEPCESSLFSSYINVNGEYWNCSFCEGEIQKGIKPVNVLDATDFIEDVWYAPQVEWFRKRLLKNQRKCLPFPEINEEAQL